MDLFNDLLFAVGRMICHQRPDRSFFIDGHQLPVCARCTGIYLSSWAGLVVFAAFKLTRGWRPIPIDPWRAGRLILITAIPTAVSLASGTLGVWDGANITRAILALPFGFTAGVVAAAAATKDLR